MSVVYFILLLGGLIFFHELGHYVMARLLGVHVVTFSIGFGPTLLSWRSRGTDYRLAALPLGGRDLVDTDAVTHVGLHEANA